MTSTTGLTATNKDLPEQATVRPGMATAAAASPAFTLIELIVVMAVIAVVLAIAAPSLRGFFLSRQASDMAAQILALAQAARSQAVCEGQVYRLNVDTQIGECWLTAQQQGAFKDPPARFGRRLVLPQGVTVAWEDPPAAPVLVGSTISGPTNTGGQMLGGQAMSGLRVSNLAMCMQIKAGQAAERTYISFYPSGATEPAALRITGQQGETYRIVCESATDSFRVIGPNEEPNP